MIASRPAPFLAGPESASPSEPMRSERMVSEGKIRKDSTTRGDLEKAMKSIKVPILYMPSETDLHFPVSDGRYEAAFIEA